MYWLIFILNIFIYGFAFNYISRNGGIRYNIPFSLCLLIFLVYSLITPSYYYAIGYIGIYDLDIRDYYLYGLIVFTINIFFFTWGYIGFNSNRPKKNISFTLDKFKVEKTLTLTFYVLFIVVLGNLLLGGIDVANLFNIFSDNDSKGKTILFSVKEHVGFSNYLGNLADSLITCIIMASLFGFKKKKIFFWAIPSLFLFALMGFRYRIILVMIGLFYVYLIKNTISGRRWKRLILIVGISIYGILFITQNRFEFARRNFDKIEMVDFSNLTDLLALQTRGGIADITLFRYYKKDNADYDFGETIVSATIVRALPSFLFTGNIKPEPPYKDNVKDMWKDARYKPWGEAVTIVGFHYIMLGMLGVGILAFILGFFVKRVQVTTNYNSGTQITFLIIVALALFQYCTRGYFPQAVDHFIFLSVPYFILLIVRKRLGHLVSGSILEKSSVV